MHAPLSKYFMHRSFGPMALSTGGDRIAYVATDGDRPHLWEAPLDGGPASRRLTPEGLSVRGVAWSARHLVVAADRVAEERPQLFRVDGGVLHPLSHSASVQHLIHPGCFAPDGETLAFAANLDEPTDLDVYLLDVARGQSRRIFARGGYLLPAGWTPDGAHLLVAELRSADYNQLWLVEVATGESRLLSAALEPAWFAPGGFSPDGRYLYVACDSGRDLKALARLDLDGRLEWLHAPERDVATAAISGDGRILAWVEEDDCAQRLFARDLVSGRDFDTTTVPPGVLVDGRSSDIMVTPDGSGVVFQLQQPTHPRRLCALRLPDGRLHVVADGSDGVAELVGELLAPESVRYASFDGREVPALFYRPRTAGPWPCVVGVHGGPRAKERWDYSPLWQFMASRGVAVLLPNYRGSAGLGREWASLLDGDWGGGDVLDLEHATRHLQAVGCDPRRFALLGVSYGGYSVLSCATRPGHSWAAAVSLFGAVDVSNLASHVSPTWRRFLLELAGDPERLRARSPLERVRELRCPVQLIQGGRDPRVPRATVESFVAAARSHGAEVEYLVFDEEGHGFSSRANEIEAFTRVAEFLMRHLSVEP